jgi:hypothetical protein
MKKKTIIIFLGLMLFFSCSDKNNRGNTNESYGIQSSVHSDTISRSFLKRAIVEKGDIETYKRLSLYCGGDRYLQILPYSIAMSEKHDNAMANFDIYNLIVRFCNEGNYKGRYNDTLFANLNEEQKRFAFYYLEKGAKRRHPGCVVILERLYRNGIGLKKDVVKADSIAKVDTPLNPY